ncbi:hypothetical protein LAZ67_X002596 [Cordylochernes scorpioides]|uniref:ATP-dependent DNA helicase n=1 Tax=Cordylochernes scorpioides TaxID=51811 RepID=A0ABY6LTI0_9ARAC|nr:hypothetical protein LAZ67_X002596 [Cordylochernes scorpioides]
MRTNAIDLANIDEKEIIEFYCGQMNERCEFCNSLNFMGERPPDRKFSACCHKGKIDLPEQDYPEYLETLMNGVDHNSKNFMENFRSYNSSLAFASMGANIATPPGYGPYCFRIHGQIYHRTGTLHPVGEQPPKFAQLYILDTAEATRERLSIPENHGCDENVLNKLAELLANINKFAMSYKMLRDVEKEAIQEANNNDTELPNIVMAIKNDRTQDVRRYNKPTASEVAVVFQNDDGEPPFIRDILINSKPIENQPMLKRISILDPNLDALGYPLFYPRAEQGWTTYLKQKPGSSQRLSQMQYYSYLLSVRDRFNPLLNGGKLTQQFIVDAYVKMEANRLHYIEENQSKLRTEKYSGLMDHINARAENENLNVGKAIILPSSFEGSPRNMHQRYQDAMSIVIKYGKPDLFVTMTCNPKWKEITENLEPWQKAEHRPDLVARVFNLKLKELLKEIKAGLFGKLAAMVHTLNHDEPTKFVDSRYVGPVEAGWRIFGFHMHEQSHAIIRLAVHLPDYQDVVFNDDISDEQLQNRLSRDSTLMGYFKLNRADPNAREYLYREIPEHYTWNCKERQWNTRKLSGAKVIGRMSFKSTLEDGVVMNMPKQLRELFAYICAFGPLAKPRELWDEFKPHMCEDFCRKRHPNDDACTHCEGYAMKEISDIFLSHRVNYNEYGLPVPAWNIPDVPCSEEYISDTEVLLAADKMKSFNAEQTAAYDQIMAAVKDVTMRPKCFFIDGPGGSGKTYLYTTLMHSVRGMNQVVLPAATTGIAANLLQGGKTMHSLYGLPIPLNETSVSNIKMTTMAAGTLRKAKLFIIDECTMASNHALNTIDRLLREVMTEDKRYPNQIPFGGKVLILFEIFSDMWSHFEHLPFVRNVRARSDPEYTEWLLKLGNGSLPTFDDLGADLIEIPQELICKDDIVREIFGDTITPELVETMSQRAILCPKNYDVHNMNDQVMDLIVGDYHTYLRMPPRGLRLKVGCIIQLLRNLKKGLCNGTRFTIKSLKSNVIEAEVLTGSNKGDIVLIPRIDLAPSETGLPFIMKRRQFPVKPAFVMTINKAQVHCVKFTDRFWSEDFKTKLNKMKYYRDRTGVTLKHCSMAYWLKVITALLIIRCIELNPGPKRQATLTNIPHSTPGQATLTNIPHSTSDQAPMDDLKLLIINLSAEVNRLGEKMDARLLNIEQKMKDWERRMTGIETSIGSCTDALATNTRLISHNTLKIRILEERAEALERQARENNLIIYGIESAETDSRELLLQKVKKLMAEDMQITDDVVIAECHRLGRGPKAPILIEVPDHESRISLLKNSSKLRILNIFMSRDYRPQIREQRKILIEKRRELYKKGIRSKLRDNKLLLNGINYMEVEGQVVNVKGELI